MWVSLCLLSSCGCADPASAGNRDPDAVCSGVELFQVFVPVFAALRRAVPVSVLQQLLPYFPVSSSAPPPPISGTQQRTGVEWATDSLKRQPSLGCCAGHSNVTSAQHCLVIRPVWARRHPSAPRPALGVGVQSWPPLGSGVHPWQSNPNGSFDPPLPHTKAESMANRRATRRVREKN